MHTLHRKYQLTPHSISEIHLPHFNQSSQYRNVKFSAGRETQLPITFQS